MNTAFLLMAQYDGRAVVPLDLVCKDYFSHLTPDEMARKIGRGEIKLPLVRIETSKRAARGVHLTDLADWIDSRRAAAHKEIKQLTE